MARPNPKDRRAFRGAVSAEEWLSEIGGAIEAVKPWRDKIEVSAVIGQAHGKSREHLGATVRLDYFKAKFGSMGGFAQFSVGNAVKLAVARDFSSAVICNMKLERREGGSVEYGFDIVLKG